MRVHGAAYAVRVHTRPIMLSILAVVLPIFALIFAGWGARRTGMLGPHATKELNRFVVYLALPALLFDIVAKARWHDLWQPGFLVAIGAGIVLVFALTLAIRWRGGHPLADASVDGLNAAYANNGFIGFPLAAAVFGSAALAPTLISVILTVCVLFAGALVLIELGLQTEPNRARMLGKVAASLARNPLLIAPAAGVVFLAFGIAVPAPAETFLKLLGGAASPCALVALGLFLAEPRVGAPPRPGMVALLVFLKLVVQPAITWAAALALGLSPFATHCAVLLAALPTGTGPFMLAEFYGREAGLTARVVLISTIVSLGTITLYLGWVG